jgi:hypothetical protein
LTLMYGRISLRRREISCSSHNNTISWRQPSKTN